VEKEELCIELGHSLMKRGKQKKCGKKRKWFREGCGPLQMTIESSFWGGRGGGKKNAISEGSLLVKGQRCKEKLGFLIIQLMDRIKFLRNKNAGRCRMA